MENGEDRNCRPHSAAWAASCFHCPGVESRPLEVFEPRLALEIGRHGSIAQGFRGGNVGLELDDVRAAVRGGVDKLHRIAETAVVYGANLGNDGDV